MTRSADLLDSGSLVSLTEAFAAEALAPHDDLERRQLVTTLCARSLRATSA